MKDETLVLTKNHIKMKKNDKEIEGAKMTEETRDVKGEAYTYKKAHKVLFSEAKSSAFNFMLSQANRLNNCEDGFTYRAQTPPIVTTNSIILAPEQMDKTSLYVRKEKYGMENLAVYSEVSDLGKDGIHIMFTASSNKYMDLAKELTEDYRKKCRSELAEVWDIPFSVLTNDITDEEMQAIVRQVVDFLKTDKRKCKRYRTHSRHWHKGKRGTVKRMNTTAHRKLGII